MKAGPVATLIISINSICAIPWIQSNYWSMQADAFKKSLDAANGGPRTASTAATTGTQSSSSISGIQFSAPDPVREAASTASEHARRSPDPIGLVFFPLLPDHQKPHPYGFIEFIYTSPTSAKLEVRLANFPEGVGDFTYHIHTDRVPDHITDPLEQCKLAKGHLDPAAIGDTKPCDTSKKSTCQAGDLSGKQGKIPGTIKTSEVYKEVYDEPYISWKVEDGNYFVNRSVVIHEATSKARIACANIMAL